MVHGFANQSGGGVDLESHPGVGTTIRLYLPKAAWVPGAEQRFTGTAASTCNAEVVLLVDDEALGRMAMAMALRELGYTVHEARNGQEALAALERKAHIDLMITDYAMPGMTGEELAAAVRRSYPGMKVMMITGYAAAIFDEDEVGLSAILRKPFRMEDLAAQVRYILANEKTRKNIVAFE